MIPSRHPRHVVIWNHCWIDSICSRTVPLVPEVMTSPDGSKKVSTSEPAVVTRRRDPELGRGRCARQSVVPPDENPRVVGVVALFEEVRDERAGVEIRRIIDVIVEPLASPLESDRDGRALFERLRNLGRRRRLHCRQRNGDRQPLNERRHVARFYAGCAASRGIDRLTSPDCVTLRPAE